MGMGNDGIDVSNSLDTDIQLNNSGARDVKTGKSIDDMQDENAMGNITGRDGVRMGSSQTLPSGDVDSGNINNSRLQTTGDVRTHAPSQSETQVSNTVDDSDQHNKETDVDGNTNVPEENGVPPSPAQTGNNDVDKEIPPSNENAQMGTDDVDKEIPPSNENAQMGTDDGDKETPPSNENASYGNRKPTVDSPDADCHTTAAPPLPAYRNESLLRVSYLKRDWGGKRVTDIRSVSELMETFTSLDEPVIMPLPRQRDYYDQWARMPRCDVIQRLYPRAGSSVSTKCWALFQTIQSDQSSGKANGASVPPPTVFPPQKLAPPTLHPSEVTYNSLDSIIDHYNQLLHGPPVEITPTTPPPTTSPAHRHAPSQNRTNSGSSRSSSGNSSNSNQNHSNSSNPNHSNNSNPSNNIGSTKQDDNHSNSLKTPLPRTRTSPNPSRKSKPAADQSPDPNPRHPEVTQTPTNHCVKKTPFPDFELTVHSASDAILSNVEVYDIAVVQRLNQMTSPVPPNGHVIRPTEVADHAHRHNETTPQNRVNGQTGLPMAQSARETGRPLATPQPDPHCLDRLSTELCYRDTGKNSVGINPNTLSLSLPYERAHTVADMHPSPTHGTRSKHLSHLDSNDVMEAEKLKAPEKHERFPLRSTAFISRGKRANTVLEYAHSQARLRNITRSIPTTSHNIKNLKDSLVIHEINCDLENSNEEPRKWEYPVKRRGRSSHHRVHSLQHPKARPVPQLPERMHSMLEQHLRPSTPPGDTLSPLEGTPSRGNSAVSLASVHFLDLADLKKLLKKSNTTIPHL